MATQFGVVEKCIRMLTKPVNFPASEFFPLSLQLIINIEKYLTQEVFKILDILLKNTIQLNMFVS